MTSRVFTTLVAASIALALAAGSAAAATIHVPGDQPTIAAAIGVASPGDLILVAPGTYVIGATIPANVAGLTIQGSGAGSTTLQVASAVGNAFAITGAGTTLRDFTVQKTDLPGAPHNLVWINANNVTVRDNVFFGPDPGSPWSVNGIVSRAMVVSPGLSGLLIEGNTIHTLRQPAYIDANGSLPVGSIVNNHVSGTRGWVTDGAKLVFSGNTWGLPANQGTEIALFASCNPADYPDLMALSLANGNAHINAQWPGGTTGRATGYVNASAASGGLGSALAPFTTITAGIANTLPGGTVQVAGGTYTEQVVVSGKNLTIQGAGRASTIVKSPATLATSFTTSAANFPVMLLQNAPDIRVRDLTVDGDGKGNANYRFLGVAFWNAGGQLLDCDVLRVRNTPWDGTQHGNAVYAFNNVPGAYSIEVGGCNVSDFQKNGITMNGAGLVANVHDCVVTGGGATPITAQNGVQVAFDASATLTNNAVANIGYTGPNFVACGLLLFGPGPMTISGGSVTNTQFGCYLYDANGSLTGTSIASAFVAGGPLSGNYYPAYGIGAYNTSATLLARGTGARAADRASRPPVSPVEETVGSSATLGAEAATATVGVTISGGCLTGADQPNSIGLEVWSAGGPLNVTATGLEVRDWDTGLFVDGSGVTMNAHHDAITSNVTAGYTGTAGPVHGATPNWWGHASGPSGAGPGSGDAVTGATVAFAPWLISGADTQPGCGFAPSADNLVTVGPAPSCLSATNTCLTIPVNVARTTSDAVRGFSVTLQLSSNLMLCSPTGSILEGTYLNSVSGTTFQVVNNGGGSYTVDAAILGLPCGATAATGHLFDLQVKKASGPDGIGTITLGPVLMRDCANAPVVASAGAPLSITIDTGGPVAITNLSALQKKLGNDADGTTKIQLAFTAPVDAATVEVYRAPYGQYPEYDDAGGSPPASPAYPPGAPWVLTAVTAAGQFDEPATRDFWYYVGFTKDACGNVSPVSNRTNGTLNYHLGDVTNGTPGSGDNLVGTIDITLLGSNYGINLGLLDPLAYLDVGPTTDFSVNGRPTTDNKVGFEDLMMFAINYGTVSAPQNRAAPVAASSNALDLGSTRSAGSGETIVVPVLMHGAGDVMGASLAFDFDRNVVQFLSAEAGELLRSQDRGAVVFTPTSGVVDFALLGEGAGVRGEGALVNLAFRRVAAGDPAIALRGVTARDGANRPVELTGAGPATPATTMLARPYPNPFRDRTNLRLALAREAHVRVGVYDLVGRRVRTLADGVQPAGERTMSWDGRDDRGRTVAAGLYLVRFDGAGVRQSHRLIVMP